MEESRKLEIDEYANGEDSTASHIIITMIVD
jgi:hypothetical protein